MELTYCSRAYWEGPYHERRLKVARPSIDPTTGAIRWLHRSRIITIAIAIAIIIIMTFTVTSFPLIASPAFRDFPSPVL